VGDIALRIPKLREGSYFPSLLEPRRRAERALLSVVQQAYIQGVSTRKVDELVQALGLAGVDKSADSRLCRELDEVVEQFRLEAMLVGDPGLTPIQVFVRLALELLAVGMLLSLMLAISELAVLSGIGPRMRAVLRWFPVLLALLCSIHCLLDDLHALSTLVITITP
jgi:hypothetical protein